MFVNLKIACGVSRAQMSSFATKGITLVQCVYPHEQPSSISHDNVFIITVGSTPAKDRMLALTAPPDLRALIILKHMLKHTKRKACMALRVIRLCVQ
jgi:hypothetical protein